ncbi:MAG: ABC transporter permease [Caldilineae bacterium]|nr:ABC transporter permease [Anaerolineae bacterium]MCB0254886.1 ABC transporter permease [Anaerolineae bacterium]MCB9154104.1 ABC transporter permease [Caldilineae bacterium]
MATQTGETAATSKRSFLRADAAQKLLAFSALIIIFIFFSLASPFFRTPDNVSSILVATAVNGVLALGVTFVIITAGIDLSVGTVMTLSAVMTGVAVTNRGLPIPVGIIVGLLTGTTAGLISGLMIARMKIPPFIATLGMMMIARGLSLVISDVKPIYFNDTPVFREIMMGSVVGALIPGLSVPNAVFILFGAALVAAFILGKTVLGRYAVAIGSNEEATRLSGVNVANWLTAVYALGGAFSGLAGVMIASRLNSAQPALGIGYELEAIAAVVIGGTSLSGGEGTILGTVIGALIISTLTNGLRILSVPQEWQMVITGVIVVLAVYIDIIRRRGK